MMEFYFARGACSLGIHVLLEEAGASYRGVAIDLRAAEQFSETFRAVNPKSKVPALVRAEGGLLTEFQTIALWIARTYPEANLLPGGFEGELRALELLDFIVGTVHMRGFTLILVPGKFVSEEAAQTELRAHGRDVVEKGLAQLSEQLADRDWLLGDYSIADAGLFYMTMWADRIGLALPANIAAFRERMLARPAVRRALELEA
jgi:glutathione S-transferase